MHNYKLVPHNHHFTHIYISVSCFLLPVVAREIAGSNMGTKEMMPVSPSEYNNHDEEAPTTHIGRKEGGWITFPFITVALTGLTITAAGWITNLIVYLIEQFNVKNIRATQISIVVNGSTSFIPIAGAIIADSYLGNFFVISVSSIISLLGLTLFTLSATLESLRPKACKQGLETCEAPSHFQLAILYSAITLASIGMGGTRFTIAAMGANQFVKPKDQRTFFNWFFVVLYLASVVGVIVIVYIEDNVSWGLGFGICLALNAIGLAAFLFGKRYYRHIKPNGSPFTSLARVAVATIRKMNVMVSSDNKDYYYGHTHTGETKLPVNHQGPTSSFRFLNRAAMKTEGDTEQEGKLTESWSLCTVQQVEDLKTLLRIFPLWSTSIFLSTPIGIQSSLIVLQALRMDRHLGQHVNIPAGSFIVANLIATAFSLPVIDQIFFPVWKTLIRQSMTPLQRIGIGHVLNIVGMAGSALVESRRLEVAKSHNLTHQLGSIVPMSAFWLVIPLVIVGIGEAFHIPGQVALYYQEFPTSLRSTATAMIALLTAVGFYLSTALIDLIRRVTGWLPDNINEGRIDNVFWVLVVIGVINLGYYKTCAMLYRYKNVENAEEKSESASDVG